MPKETKPTPRTVFMEFDIAPGILPEDVELPLRRQLGIDPPDGENWPEQLTILVPVGEGKGGPKALINKLAKAPGVFRAVATSALGPRKAMKPPPDDQLVMEDLD